MNIRTIRAAVLVFVVGSSALPGAAFAQVKASEEKGTLPDGTIYGMRVPANWNKTVIRDLDYAGRADSPRYQELLKRGYAVSGTMRHRMRIYRYDPAREIANLDSVLDRFQTRFGKPARVIQFGCSGGGHATLAVAENFSNRIDGAIALGAHTPVWIMNTFLDGWFALKVLIGSDKPATGGGEGAAWRSPADLVIVNLPNGEPFNPSGHGLHGSIPAAWREAIDAAQKTPEGRARIALAFAIGQWPAWVNKLTPQPSLEDVAALQHAMYHTVYQNAGSPGGEARVIFENAALGQQPSWNTGVDYREFFENGNESFKQAVRQLYKEAGLDLEADLKKINAAPRIAASPYALDYWKAPGRNVVGKPQIPLLRMHEIGDYQVPISLVQGYDARIRANGKEDLYRTAFVRADGHCGFNAAETTAAVELMKRRLDTGKWQSTDPDSLNMLAASLGTGTTARFITIDKLKQKKYNRAWEPETR